MKVTFCISFTIMMQFADDHLYMNRTAVKKDEAEEDDNDVGTESNASKDSKDATVKATRPQGRSIRLCIFFCFFVYRKLNVKLLSIVDLI